MSSRWKGRGENLARKGQAKLPRYFNALLAVNGEKDFLVFPLRNYHTSSPFDLPFPNLEKPG
jgi:hypothetical protein